MLFCFTNLSRLVLEIFRFFEYHAQNLNTPQNNSASWDLQMGFNSAFKGLKSTFCYNMVYIKSHANFHSDEFRHSLIPSSGSSILLQTINWAIWDNSAVRCTWTKSTEGDQFIRVEAEAVHANTHRTRELQLQATVLPEKLGAPRLVKKFPAFMRARHLSLPWARPISIPLLEEPY